MKKLFLWFLALFIFSCAFIPKIKEKITWPENIKYIEAMCELDMAWASLNYSGSMSLVMEYPDRLFIEAYSPFGDTVFFLDRYKDYFLLLTGDERITDEKDFEERFKINIKNFIEDLSLKGVRDMGRGEVELNRDGYKVIYGLKDKNTICWQAEEGSICIKFIEARFKKEG
ncbi:MAG: hypothetical protein N2596_08745 [Syntrophorhabdaceae bacterium]|nr:hypothetical protein [Syntrophorhabdaceae bacterium]